MPQNVADVGVAVDQSVRQHEVQPVILLAQSPSPLLQERRVVRRDTTKCLEEGHTLGNGSKDGRRNDSGSSSQCSRRSRSAGSVTVAYSSWSWALSQNVTTLRPADSG